MRIENGYAIKPTRESVLEHLRIGDLDGLEELRCSDIINDPSDIEELSNLIKINDIIGVGWGEDKLKLGMPIWYRIESDYFDRKMELLNKYNLLEVE